jgi:hypothetical protein
MTGVNWGLDMLQRYCNHGCCLSVDSKLHSLLWEWRSPELDRWWWCWLVHSYVLIMGVLSFLSFLYIANFCSPPSRLSPLVQIFYLPHVIIGIRADRGALRALPVALILTASVVCHVAPPISGPMRRPWPQTKEQAPSSCLSPFAAWRWQPTSVAAHILFFNLQWTVL